MVRKTRIAILASVLTLFGGVAAADTLIVVGVAVNAKGERLSGALVRLYATQSRLGAALTEDRTSDRGVFSLYRTNIAGDIGELYVVYMGDGGRAEPLKVLLGNPREGRLEARTNDLIVLQVPATAAVTEPQAIAYIAAATNTESVLVRAGAKSQSDADVTVRTETATVLARARVTERFETIDAQNAIKKRLIDDILSNSIKGVPVSAK